MFSTGARIDGFKRLLILLIFQGLDIVGLSSPWIILQRRSLGDDEYMIVGELVRMELLGYPDQFVGVVAPSSGFGEKPVFGFIRDLWGSG